ncbi:unnamed protein product [Miscanthus lutarioriparius]|uniref:Uncharacterized protein n=1 Tax=Miscanthus lutarioriparius TaxID=422564 RepID=A0A811QRJ3_9POAL|nr:unnamed protein product [Miscanthus lutarioriparius]
MFQHSSGINENGLTESGVGFTSSLARRGKQYVVRHATAEVARPSAVDQRHRRVQHNAFARSLGYAKLTHESCCDMGRGKLPAMTAACQSWFAAAVDDSEGEQRTDRE